MKKVLSIGMLFILSMLLVSCGSGNGNDKKKKKGCRRCAHHTVIETVINNF